MLRLNSFRNSLIAGAAAVFGLAATASASTVTVDFEGFAPGDTISAGTDVGFGLSFDRDIRISDAGFLVGEPVTSGNVAFAPAPPFFQGDDVRGMFSSETSFVRLGAGDVGFDLDTATLTAFDMLGNIVGTDSFRAQAAQILEVQGAGITSFLLEFDDVRLPEGTGSAAFDNIQFEIAPVPLPAAFPLLLVAVGGLGMVARRRKANSAA